jgi:hypothetical protein
MRRNSCGRHRGRWAGLISALLATAVAGCGDDEAPAPEPMGHLAILLTDAPFPFDMVDSTVVTIDSVSVHLDSEWWGSGFLTVDRTPRLGNLLDLRGGVTDTLGSVDLPAGRIGQVRLYVSSPRIFLSDGRSFDLEVPSGSQSGIKVFPDPPIEVVGDLTTELLLDFDVSQSFQAIPSSPRHVSEIEGFHFLPVLHVQNLSEVGSLSGTVYDDRGTPGEVGDDLPLGDASVAAFLDEVEVTATVTRDDGYFRVMGLLPGMYTLVASATGFQPDSLDREVVVGNDIGGNVLRLSPMTAE